MFVELQNLSPNWPKIMWNNYSIDKAICSLELGELLSRNLHSRMTPFEFSDEILKLNKGETINKSELCLVLEGEIFLDNANLHADNISPGDVFSIESNYYVNIRAACDLFPDRYKVGAILDDVELYLLKGFTFSDKEIEKSYSKEYGNFSERDNQIIIFPMVHGKAIDFHFKTLNILKWSELKDKRIGRILPPYITKIQQKYAQYLQRQGFPRTPNEAIVNNITELEPEPALAPAK